MSGNFVTEADLEEARKNRQAEWERVRKPDDPEEAPEETYDHRSLFERLEEHKRVKQEEWDIQHDIKNVVRGIDDDEASFLDKVDDVKAEIENKRLMEERHELNEYRKMKEKQFEEDEERRLKIEMSVKKLPQTTSKILEGTKKQSKLLLGAVVKKRPISETEDSSSKNEPSKKAKPTLGALAGLEMEELSNRFPTLITKILEIVDDQSLVKFKETSREMSRFIANDRLYWIRIMKKYNQSFVEFSNAWKLVIEKTPVAMVRKIALDVQRFFKTHGLFGEWYDYDSTLRTQWSPLHIIAETDDLDLLKHIVVKTEDVNYEPENCSNKYTALHLAAEKGSLAACVFIINWSFYKGGKDKYGRTPIDTAAIHSQWEVCKYLLENSDDFPMGNFKIPLWLAAYYNQPEVYKLFFEHTRARNLPFNPPNSSDLETPLHQAADRGNLEICKLIIRETQDIGQATYLSGRTPLHCAAQDDPSPIRLEIFKLIFDNVQDKEPKDKDGRTPFHHAAKYGNLEVCKLIIGETENKNPTDSAGWTPLHCAAQNGHEEICALIASKVVDKNPGACDGTTPEFLMRRYRLFSEEFRSISPRVERRKQARWNGFEEINNLNGTGNTVWWARTPNKTFFNGFYG